MQKLDQVLQTTADAIAPKAEALMDAMIERGIMDVPVTDDQKHAALFAMLSTAIVGSADHAPEFFQEFTEAVADL